MSEATALTVNAATGESVIVPLSQEELDFIETVKAEAQEAQQAKEAARSSALAKLAALGLTEEEIAAL